MGSLEEEEEGEEAEGRGAVSPAGSSCAWGALVAMASQWRRSWHGVTGLAPGRQRLLWASDTLPPPLQWGRLSPVDKGTSAVVLQRALQLALAARGKQARQVVARRRRQGCAGGVEQLPAHIQADHLVARSLQRPRGRVREEVRGPSRAAAVPAELQASPALAHTAIRLQRAGRICCGFAEVQGRLRKRDSELSTGCHTSGSPSQPATLPTAPP